MANYAMKIRVRGLKSQSEESLCKDMIRGFKEAFGEEPSQEQSKAFIGVIRHVKELSERLDNSLQDAFIVFEYALPFGNERIDLLMFGKGKEGKNTIAIFELKGWQKANEIDENLVEVDGEAQQHPELQILNYAGRLKFSHSDVKDFEMLKVVWLYNLPHKANLHFSDEVKVFYKDQVDLLADFLKNGLYSHLEEEEVDRFLSGRYEQSPKLLEVIDSEYENLKEGVYRAICAKGVGPSEDQHNLIEEIIYQLKKGEKVSYLVSGGPGSGKTYVAMLLLLRALKEGFKAVLGYRNNRLLNTIRDVLNGKERGIGSTIIQFYSTGRGSGLAEGDPQNPHFQLAIFDEAQRMTKDNIKIAMQRGDITVFFFDENQILNLEEEGTEENFKCIANSLGIKLEFRELKGVYRVKGVIEYHNFVEDLLNGKAKSLPNLPNYDIKVFDSIIDMIKALKEKVNQGYKVALVAAFTESPGDRKRPTEKTIDNLRVGYPLKSGFDRYKNIDIEIYWLMDEKRQYPQYWYGNLSNNLTHCASIYGCQGFEADYVGVIWCRDFVWRSGQWEIGSNSEDSIGNTSLKRLIKNKDKEALPLLKNRYRIFLTRGILGTYIYCEDDATMRYLKSLMRN